ncbi:hypothetical protein C8F04DRAFT_1272020 [Mycena alexandri]|uniref:Uncharacterized protein n=1 Tax=Mycena alexandri TaxID=1745969 RepID=A0AAD6S832_9AGAR|nr:hypothetical protein C8F04DRAFT_1272020 [Mycena alexandri]
MSRFLPLPLAAYRQLVAQSPEVVRIFQARWLLNGYRYLNSVYARLLLHEPWDNIMRAVAAFRSATENLEVEGIKNPLQVIAATTITLLALSLELFPDSAQNLLGELACGCLRPLDLHLTRMRINLNTLAWGQLVRCSPYPNSPLLCALEEFTPTWDNFNSPLMLSPVEFHDVIQWLKAHSDLPMVLIARWEGYLAERQNLRQHPGMSFSEDLESRWESSKFWRSGENPSESKLRADFDEEAVIRSYERAIESLGEGPLAESDLESESLAEDPWHESELQSEHDDDIDEHYLDTDEKGDDMYE